MELLRTAPSLQRHRNGATGNEKSEDPADLTDPELIKRVQNALNENGYDCGAADGITGSRTAAAITAFQTEKGLEATGTITQELVTTLGAG